MAAGVGSKVESLDYNQIQTIVNNVFGTGSGDAGYGQIVTSSQVAQHAVVSVTQWNSLRNDLLKARQHQSGVDESGNLGIPTLDIKLTEADRAAYLSMATLINNNRTISPPSSEASLFTLITSNRSSGWTGTIDQTITIEFGTANKLRWYFNAGGNFQISASLTNYATTGDSKLVNESWEVLLRNMGIITLSNSSTTNTGTGTPATSIGYANLTSTDQLIFTKLVEGSSQYTPNQYQLKARILGGSALVLTPTWSYTDAGNDGAYRVFEPVIGTLTSVCQMYIATGANVAVASPQVLFSGTGWTPSTGYTAPPPSYSIQPNVTLVNEGDTVTYTVTTASVPNGTRLSWRNIGNSSEADFTDGVNSGTVDITNNSATITRQVRNDLTTEVGSETIILQLFAGSTATATDAIFTSSGTWVCPAGVTSVSIVAIGGGGAGGSARLTGGTGGSGGGGGGGLAYLNSYSVTPGQTYNVTVGLGGDLVTAYPARNGGATYLSYLGSDVVRATGGIGGQIYTIGNQNDPTPAGGTFSGISGTVGQIGGTGGAPSPAGGGGGGGAGSYQFTAESGLSYSAPGVFPIPGGSGSTTTTGTQGGRAGFVSPAGNVNLPAGAGSGGGGTGLFGSKDYAVSSVGGSTGSDSGGTGGGYGGGGGGNGVGRDSGGGALSGFGGRGANGALRIVYGSQRTFPSTNVGTSISEYGVNGTPLGSPANTVTITDTSRTPTNYSITPNTSIQNEGSPVVFTITTTGIADGTLVYWINVGTTRPSDFPNTDNGVVTINGGSATITRTATADLTTEGEETIIIELHSGSVTGPVEATSATVRIVDASTAPIIPTYAVAPSINSVNEGASLTFTVTTTNVANGTVLYWTIDTNTGDFAIINGPVTINSNTAQFSVTPRADSTTEGTESFSLSIRTDSISGQQVAFSGDVTIGDASTTPPYVPPYEPPAPDPAPTITMGAITPIGGYGIGQAYSVTYSTSYASAVVGQVTNRGSTALSTSGTYSWQAGGYGVQTATITATGNGTTSRSREFTVYQPYVTSIPQYPKVNQSYQWALYGGLPYGAYSYTGTSDATPVVDSGSGNLSDLGLKIFVSNLDRVQRIQYDVSLIGSGSALYNASATIGVVIHPDEQVSIPSFGGNRAAGQAFDITITQGVPGAVVNFSTTTNSGGPNPYPPGTLTLDSVLGGYVISGVIMPAGNYTFNFTFPTFVGGTYGQTIAQRTKTVTIQFN